MKKIVVIGSTNTDMVITGRKIPVPGETVCDGTFLMNPGGKGANQAVAVARLAAEPGACTFIAKVGDDLFGRETAARLAKDGINTHLIIDSHEASGVALILVDERGQNVISVALGANGTLSETDLLPYKEEIESAAALLVQLETPIPTVLSAAKWAHEAGVPVILNPAPAAELPDELLACVDWITPNETEAELLTGVKVTDDASAAKAAQALKARGVGNVLITLGSRGCWCEGTTYPCEPVKAVDCVAAGDTFNGAFVIALTEGKSPADAVAFAQKAAGIAVTRPGAQASVPFRRELA